MGTGCPSLPTIGTHFTDTHCSLTLCHSHSTHWSQSNGSFLLPFSASNCEIPCLHPLGGLYLPIPSLSASISQSFCSHSGREGLLLATLLLTLTKGCLYIPFSASNCVIWCHIVFGWNPLGDPMGFYHQSCYLSVAGGGTTPPTEFWSCNSSTLTHNGFHSSLRSSNCVSECEIILYIGIGAHFLVGIDGSFNKNILPITCGHSMSVICAPLLPHFLIGMLPTHFSKVNVDSGARSGVGIDDSFNKSILPNTCTHSMHAIFAPLALCLALQLTNCASLLNCSTFTGFCAIHGSESLYRFACNCLSLVF